VLITVFWDVTLYSLVEVYQHLWGTNYLRLQVERVNSAGKFDSTMKTEAVFSSKTLVRIYQTTWHQTHKTVMFRVIIVMILNLNKLHLLLHWRYYRNHPRIAHSSSRRRVFCSGTAQSAGHTREGQSLSLGSHHGYTDIAYSLLSVLPMHRHRNLHTNRARFHTFATTRLHSCESNKWLQF
jgi:hypothetical protein